MPLEYDGRLSRYSSQDDAPEELNKAYREFLDSYEEKEYGLRSEFSNNYGDFKEKEE